VTLASCGGRRRSTYTLGHLTAPFNISGVHLLGLIHTAHHIRARSMVTFNAQLFHFGNKLERDSYGRSWHLRRRSSPFCYVPW
jgi:hypothetical protein